ncbi:DUF4307 domain-containing protein [Brachybacterium muris]|uniref:DUF4307 domain-containing protein n=1 Tax=Brachybacterium muris TaxID=219301 RepID=UPI00195D2065|nr:DUF4307 domain-containing protein [Brachybacterium muris]MBM7501560.1 hypothetical protein [Brachybacterium muris]MCT1998057.1 DUF4307 domain-containing protein [Brachybacterium muris]MCT2177009.1 DUF4307 domain-containing protein [Brachybacterium muris]MCT2262306.1 DUF4307 domain-containing protein [Brachybacterium muris]MCT2295857.1 DUF4307 domain-containing protein [Brachybacterium muris]
MSAAPHRPAERYGGPIVSRRTGRILVVLVAIVFLATVVLIGIRFADQPVKAEMLSYEHVAEDRIAVSFTVTMSPGTEAECAVQAMNEGRAQVGFVEVEVPAQDQRRSAHRVEIATQGDAVSAEVLGCEPR